MERGHDSALLSRIMNDGMAEKFISGAMVFLSPFWNFSIAYLGTGYGKTAVDAIYLALK
ncbi:hypothetical protein GGI35DRAFT_476652 [Trichoderma velutinum]